MVVRRGSFAVLYLYFVDPAVAHIDATQARRPTLMRDEVNIIGAEPVQPKVVHTRP